MTFSNKFKAQFQGLGTWGLVNVTSPDNMATEKQLTTTDDNVTSVSTI